MTRDATRPPAQSEPCGRFQEYWMASMLFSICIRGSRTGETCGGAECAIVNRHRMGVSINGTVGEFSLGVYKAALRTLSSVIYLSNKTR